MALNKTGDLGLSAWVGIILVVAVIIILIIIRIIVLPNNIDNPLLRIISLK